MPFTNASHPHIRLEEPTFFARPISRWLSVLFLVATAALCYVVMQQAPGLDQVIKVGLFTVPATIYLLFRSFVRQA